MKSKLISLLFLSTLFFPLEIRAEKKLGFDPYKIIYQRNIFKPLWKSNVAQKEDRSRQEELEALRKAEEERKQAQLLAEEQRKLEAKKREIERTYQLTGIIMDDRKPQAAIQDNQGATHFVYENDIIDDIMVTKIHESKGEVTVDYEKKFTVILKMQ